MDLLQNLVFLREKGEEAHLCASTKYGVSPALGSIYLTNKRVLFNYANSKHPSRYHIWFEHTSPTSTDIVLGHFVSPANHKKALLKLSVNHKGSKEDHVFEFSSADAVPERDGFKQFLAKVHSSDVLVSHAAQLLPKPKADAGSEITPGTPATPATPGTPAMPRPAASSASRNAEPTIHEVKQWAALLASNADLQLCHKQLVESGIISANEFWASRQHLIDGEKSKQSAQQRGTPTALITEVRPSQADLGGEIKYRLTPEIIRQIFLESPGVKQVYDENVPTKLSEIEFWKSQYFHRDRLTGTTINVAERDIFDKCAEEDERVYAPPVKRPRGIDPTVDVSGEDVLPDGYGDAENLRKPKAKSLSLIRRYNRHGALVLGTHPTGAAHESAADGQEKNKNKVSDSVRLPDLEIPVQPEVSQLRIKDPRLYFEGHSAAPAAPVNIGVPSAEALEAFRASVSRGERKRITVDAITAGEVLKEMQRYISRGKFNDVVSVSSVDLESEVQNKLMEYFLTINELLRHFWSTHKQTVISPESFTKLTRVSKTLRDRKGEIDAFLTQQGNRARSIFKPLMDSVDHALKAGERYLQAA